MAARNRYRRIFRQNGWRQETRSKIFVSGIRLRLFLDHYERIRQIVIYNPDFFTEDYIHVFSSVEDIFYVYGRPHDVKKIPGGVYLMYPYGIGFDIDEKTDWVRAIVIFPPR